MKEIPLQSSKFYFVKIDDDIEKMINQLNLELQEVWLLLAGAGMQGFIW